MFAVPYFGVRYLAKSLNLWRDSFDSIGLLVLSLMLFLNTDRTSFTVFVFDVVFNYLMVALMQRSQGGQARLIAASAIIINIAILAYFKYLVFFVENVVGLVANLPENWQKTSPLPVANRIPPGVSFYTFQMVAFMVDSFRARKKKPIGFLNYVNFVSFFPLILAGPIERRIDLFPQIESFRFKFSIDNFEKGFRWLSLGLFMKFVLADNLSPYIDLKETANPWFVWFQAFLFTLRIYFDFGGYSFIAVGLAKFLGIKLTLNFLAPYTSQSINEFWRRWHITLSTWFRDYVFIPLMGSKKQLAPFFLFITFTLSGFWHGAAWNFILWGAYHGSLLLVLRYLGRPFYGFVGRYVTQPQFVSWGLTFWSVILGSLFFMETNSTRLFAKLQTLVIPWNYSLANLGALFSSYSLNQGVMLTIILVIATVVLLLEHIAIWQQKFEYELLLSPWVAPVLLGLTVLLAEKTPSAFIYFEF